MENNESGSLPQNESFDKTSSLQERAAKLGAINRSESGEKSTEDKRAIQEIATEIGIKTLEFVSHKFGETVGKRVYEYLRAKAENFETDIAGLENILSVEGSFIVAPNHTRPTESWALQVGAHPDAIMLENIIEKNTGKDLGVVAKGDPGEWGNASFNFKKNVLRPIMTSIVQSLGFIPAGLLEGSVNRELFRRVAENLEEGNPILMFPEGRSYDEFSPENEFKSGVAYFSIKHQRPIIPTYIHDCREWADGSKNSVIFGEPIYPIANENKEDLTERVRQAVIGLSEEVVNLQNSQESAE